MHNTSIMKGVIDMKMKLYDATVAFMNDFWSYLSRGEELSFAQWLSMYNVTITDYDLITGDYKDSEIALTAKYGQGDEMTTSEFNALLKELDLQQYSKSKNDYDRE